MAMMTAVLSEIMARLVFIVTRCVLSGAFLEVLQQTRKAVSRRRME